MADVNLTGDARSLVGALAQASAAFIRFGTSTAQITKDVARLDKSGNILARTITVIDASGNKLVGTFKAVEAGVAGVAGSTTAAVKNLAGLATASETAAASQQILAQSSSQVIAASATEIKALQATAASLRAQAQAAQIALSTNRLLVLSETNSSRAALRRTKSVRLEAEATVLATRAIQAQAAATAAAIPITNQLAIAQTKHATAEIASVTATRANTASIVTLGTTSAATTGAVRGLATSLISLSRLIGISLLIGAAFRLVSVFTDATERAGELAINLAEIETITKDNTFSTNEWAEGLRLLSNEFGIDVLTQAEGAYQILSNQIRNASGAAIQGAEALEFLRIANELAITGVTNTAAATNLLTATINGFKLSSEDAGIVAAQLFKIVELGRVRIEDMSESFGRLVVPANQLGITLAEVGGAIAQTTIQGVKFNEASTLVRNVILKLIRPTDQMGKVFERLGVASGEALIAQEGFVGALAAIERQVGGTTTEIGKAFGRIRAITGALIFAGDGAVEAAEKIKEIRKSAQEAFGADTQRVIQSTGQQLKIAGEVAENFFEREIGTPALEAIAKWIKSVGGMEEVIRQIIDATVSFAKVATVAYGALQVARIALLIRGIASAEAATLLLTRAQVLYNAALAASPIGIFLAVVAAIALSTELIKNESRELLREAERNNLEVLRRNKDLNSKILAAEKFATSLINIELRRRTQGFLQVFGAARAELSKISKQLDDSSKDLARRFKDTISDFTKSVTSQLSTAAKSVSDFNKTVTKAAEVTKDALSQAARISLEIDLDIAGVGQQIGVLNRELENVQNAVESATRAGNLAQFEVDRKRVNQLLKTRVDAEIQLARRTSVLEAELQDARIKRQRAQGRADRQLADDRIADIERELQITRTGTAEQLKQEQRLRAAREQARVATTAEEFSTALTELNSIEAEQIRINKLVDEERQLRDKVTAAQLEQAEQAERIRIINEERAQQAKEEEIRLKSLQFIFDLVRKDAEAFKRERITEGKTALEINTAVEEQQARFAQLITLARELSGSRSTDAIFIQRDTQLREAAENKIQILRADAQAKALRETEKQLNTDLANARTIRNVQLDNLANIQKRLEDFQATAAKVADVDTLGPGGVQRGEIISAAFKDFSVLSEAQIAAIEENTDAQVADAKRLNALILLQQSEFTKERQAQIDIIAKTLVDALRAPSAEGVRPFRPGEVSLELGDAPTAAFSQAGQDLAESAFALVSGLDRLGPALATVEDQSLAIDQLVSALPEAQKVLTKATLDEVAARESSRTALEQATETANRFRDVVAGVSVEGGPTTAPGAVTPTPLELILPKNQKVLSDQTAEDLQRGLEVGAKDAAPSVTRIAEDTGRAQAKAAADETIRRAPEVEARIAAIRAQIQQRRRTITPAVAGQAGGVRGPERQVDTTIFLGQGALSIAEQQARIQEELTKLAEERLKFAQAEKAAEEARREVAQAQAREAGQTRITAEGQILTRQQTAVEREAALGPVTEVDPVEQARAVEALRLARGGGAEELERINLELANAREEENDEIRANFSVAQALGIERERALELALDENNLTQAAQDQTQRFLDQQQAVLNAQQGVQPTLIPGGVAPRDELAEALAQAPVTGANIIEQSNADLQTSLDGLKVSIDTFAGSFGVSRGFAAGGPVSGPAGTDRVPAMLTSGEFVVRKQQAAKFFPQLLAMNSGQLRPRGFADGGPVDVGGINVVVNESSSPQATTRQIVADINRGLRAGTIKLRRS